MFAGRGRLVAVAVLIAGLVTPVAAKPRVEQPNLHPFEHTYTKRPPANIPARHLAELVTGNVLVAQEGREKFSQYPRNSHAPRNAIMVYFYRSDETFVRCRTKPIYPYSIRTNHWFPAKIRLRKRDPLLPVLAYSSVPQDPEEADFGAWNHDGTTGLVVEILKHHRKPHWWPNMAGHLQERLPAAVYQLCPDFPPAHEVGLEVNEAQTAVTYPELVAQDPGRRIIRPDLVVSYDNELVR